jgi:hypothetical protein
MKERHSWERLGEAGPRYTLYSLCREGGGRVQRAGQLCSGTVGTPCSFRPVNIFTADLQKRQQGTGTDRNFPIIFEKAKRFFVRKRSHYVIFIIHDTVIFFNRTFDTLQHQMKF